MTTLTCGSSFKNAVIFIATLVATPASAQLSDSQLSKIPNDILLEFNKKHIRETFCRKAVENARRQPQLEQFVDRDVLASVAVSNCSYAFDPCECIYDELKKER